MLVILHITGPLLMGLGTRLINLMQNLDQTWILHKTDETRLTQTKRKPANDLSQFNPDIYIHILCTLSDISTYIVDDYLKLCMYAYLSINDNV